MNKIIKNIKIIFVLAIMFFIIFGIYFNPFALARERTEDLSNLINYPEIYTNIQECYYRRNNSFTYKKFGT